jgi:hypothetical protein
MSKKLLKRLLKYGYNTNRCGNEPQSFRADTQTEAGTRSLLRD